MAEVKGTRFQGQEHEARRRPAGLHFLSKQPATKIQMAGHRLGDTVSKVSLEVGSPFNPFGLFYGIFIADALVRAKGISPGAKLVYGRLVRYAGQNGDYYPAVPTLASEIALSVPQTQTYLTELERVQLIQRIPRSSPSGQTSNAYVFLWHPLFEEGMKKPAPEGVKDSSPKESQEEESQIEETNIDLD